MTSSPVGTTLGRRCSRRRVFLGPFGCPGSARRVSLGCCDRDAPPVPGSTSRRPSIPRHEPPAQGPPLGPPPPGPARAPWALHGHPGLGTFRDSTRIQADLENRALLTSRYCPRFLELARPPEPKVSGSNPLGRAGIAGATSGFAHGGCLRQRVSDAPWARLDHESTRGRRQRRRCERVRTRWLPTAAGRRRAGGASGPRIHSGARAASALRGDSNHGGCLWQRVSDAPWARLDHENTRARERCRRYEPIRR